MKTLLSLTICLYLTMDICLAQGNIIPLWPDKMPNHRSTDETETQDLRDIQWIQKVKEPTLEVYLPPRRSAAGKAVIICPGGGYQGLAYDWEGTDIAKWFNAHGIAAFVLKYRLPKSKSLLTGHEAPLQDAQRAIRLVRNNAKKWNVLEDQIGIMGFSAGGHLASTLGTHYDHEKYSQIDDSDSVSARPNFMILLYPVITMKTSFTHLGSRNNLLGKSPITTLVDYYSNEMQVTADTPPTFIVHSADDQAVPVMNSLAFYKALIKEKVYAEMHIYPEGGHGYGLAIGKGYLQSWPDRLYDWIKSLNEKTSQSQ